MNFMKAGLWSAGVIAGIVAANCGPASAAVRPRGRLPMARGFARPIQTDIGMPLPSGALNMSAQAYLGGGANSTLFVLDAGLTPRLGLEVVAPYAGLGTSGAYLSELGANVQIGLIGAPARSGISAVLGLRVPGGAEGLMVGMIQPLVGLRGQTRIGPVLGIANFGWFPSANQTDIRAAALWQLMPRLAPGLELRLMGGPTPLAAITPEINVRPIRNLGIGLGYQIPIAGTVSGQVVAQAQFFF